MGRIYEQARLTIAASWAKSSSEGCFANRNSLNVLPIIVSLRRLMVIENEQIPPMIGYLRRQDALNHYIMIPEDLFHTNIGYSPLDSRAWTCQERLLSRRVLHFAEQQVFWECTEQTLACESAPDGFPTDHHQVLNTPKFTWEASNAASMEQHKHWLDILQNYSGRQLTFGTDKLPAISAVARRVQGRLDDPYLVGLFKSYLPLALLWKSTGSPHPIQSNEYRAPSWSWASSHRSVSFSETVPTAQGRDLATIEDVQVHLVNSQDPFGQVRSASITLRGSIEELPSEEYKWNTFTFDVSAATPFLILPLREENCLNEECCYEAGLMLKPDPTPGSTYYTRVGIYRGVGYWKSNRPKHSDAQLITII
jgi:hypothetical protein